MFMGILYVVSLYVLHVTVATLRMVHAVGQTDEAGLCA